MWYNTVLLPSFTPKIYIVTVLSGTLDQIGCRDLSLGLGWKSMSPRCGSARMSWILRSSLDVAVSLRMSRGVRGEVIENREPICLGAVDSTADDPHSNTIC